MKKMSPLLTGTILLTSAGLLSRFLGFFYRIWLARIIGEASLGLFQMIFPVFGLAVALCTSGIQTAVSRFTAEAFATGEQTKALKTLFVGLFSSLALSLLSGLLLYREADFLAVRILNAPECAVIFPVLAYMLLLAAAHACIGGYYLGRKNAVVSAGSQLTEQCVRILVTLAAYHLFLSLAVTPDVLLPVIGMAGGETASFLFVTCALALTLHKFTPTDKPDSRVLLPRSGQKSGFSDHRSQSEQKSDFSVLRLQLEPGSDTASKSPGLPRFFSASVKEYRGIFKSLSTVACPLTLQRVLTGALGSLEAVLLPLALQRYGLSRDAALGLYGIFTGMAMPCIFFPSAITNSMSSMLMPLVAEAKISRDKRLLKATIEKTAAVSAAVGFACFLLFLLFGKWIGTSVLGNPAAGDYLRVLAWLCPFLYVNTTLGSVLNGLGRSGAFFVISILCSGLRLICVLALVPVSGMHGHLLGMLISTILQTLISLWAVNAGMKSPVHSEI